jgi:hypothetical protein
MPAFILNKTGNAAASYYDLDDFSKSYIEALFFTNGDTGDDDENALNDLGVEALTPESIANIAKDCAEFQEAAKDLLSEAYDAGYSIEQAGADFWFTRQGHGVGFWDREALEEGELGEKLSNVARKFRESYAYIGDDGAIYIQ